MFTVGQFAQLAQVSVRTLHHYDELGLLEPAVVVKKTGYRSYEARQLRDLNRILVLKELGFTLREIGDMAESEIGGDELLGMLRLRQAEAERKAADERQRLEQVAARIKLLTEDPSAGSAEASVVVKPLEGMRLAAIVEVIDGFDDVDFGELLPKLFRRLVDETLRIDIRPPVGPIQAHFPRRDDGRVSVIAGVPVEPDEERESDIVVMLDVPAVERAATVVRQGHFTEGRPAVEALTRWLEATDQQSAFDHYREVYLQSEGPSETWVAEYQLVLND